MCRSRQCNTQKKKEKQSRGGSCRLDGSACVSTTGPITRPIDPHRCEKQRSCAGCNSREHSPSGDAPIMYPVITGTTKRHMASDSKAAYWRSVVVGGLRRDLAKILTEVLCGGGSSKAALCRVEECFAYRRILQKKFKCFSHVSESSESFNSRVVTYEIITWRCFILLVCEMIVCVILSSSFWMSLPSLCWD